MIAIGIDIGGTSIKGAAVNSNGKVYETFSMPFIKGEPGVMTIRKLANLVKDYIARFGLEKEVEKALDSQKKVKENTRKKTKDTHL